MTSHTSGSRNGRYFLAVLTLAIAGSGFLVAEDGALLVAPQSLHSGGRSALTLSTLDASTREPVSRSAVISLLDSSGSEVAGLFAGETGADGHERVGFDVPALPAGTYTLQARIDGVVEPLEVATTVSRTPAILIETDKPIYKPGQTLQGRVVLLNNSLLPVAGDVEVTFHDAKGIRIDRKPLTTDEYGVAPFSLVLATELNFGTWKVRATSENAESARDVRVEEYVLPRYSLDVTLDKSWALVSDTVTGTVDARYFFGQNVEGNVSISAKRWVGVLDEYATLEGTFENGLFRFELPPVDFVSGTPGDSGQGSVVIDVRATDSTGHTQTTSETLVIAQAPVVLALIPRSKTLKPGILAEVVVTSEEPDGSPVSTAVDVTANFISTLGERLDTVTTNVSTVNGVGILGLVPPAETAYAELSAQVEIDGKTAVAYTDIGSAYSSGGSFISLARIDGTGPAAVGQVLEFSVTSTNPGTVYYEVYAGGRTVLSDASEEDRFLVTVTPDMVPAARVVAYKINPDSEVAADSLSFNVNLSLSVSVSAEFSAEEVKPGDPIEIFIDAGTGQRTLLGVSVVDNSVLALGRSRLHLEEVFAELERRFLEPQVQVIPGGGHPGGPVGGPAPPQEDFVADRFFGPPPTSGALDTLHEVGLEIATSSNLRVPQGDFPDFFRFDDFLEAGPPAAPDPQDDGVEGSGLSQVRVRQFFPETWVWEPTLLSDENGRATLTLEAPDSITSWKLGVVSTTPGPAQSGIGFGEAELTVFQDFFVEPSLPFSVTRGEEFPVKVDVFNYLDAAQSIQLDLTEAEGFELVGQGSLQVDVDANSATSVSFPIRPTGLGTFPLSIAAVGSTRADIVLREILVVPEGRPEEIVINSVIETGTSAPLDLSFPNDSKTGLFVIPGSARAFLNITPSPVAQTMEGIEDLLDMPYGCGEQNMIYLAPDIEILKYLREIGELTPEIRAQAELFVNTGYQRQLTFQTDDGGFAAFGGEEGSLWLTAFVLSTFAGAREVRDIDENVLAQSASMLLSRQNADGSFRTDDFLIHKEMDGGLENLYAMTAYVTNALADYGGAEVATGLANAAGYLSSHRTTLRGVNDDAYSLSIAAVALLKVPGFEASAEATIDRLLELAIEEGIGIHWEPYPVETTGYVTMALLEANGGTGRPEASAALDWLTTQRNSLGGYGDSTQDTVVAIRAVFQAARKVRRDISVDLSVVSEEGTIFDVHVDETNFDLFHQRQLPLTAGPLELRSEGSGSVGYQVVKRFNVPSDFLPPPRDMILNVSYDASHIEVDDIVDVSVRVQYTGFKEETGMVIADIGVPTGFAPVRSSLDALVEAEVVERVEVAGRKVIFYITGLFRDEPLEFVFEVLSLYPVRAEGPISRAYEYYDADVEAFHQQPSLVTFEAPPQVPFIRGDSNNDGLVQLSDSVRTLGFLFIGDDETSGAFCADAADADDNGRLILNDPILVLNHLFLGGPAPAPPFPEAGIDPTSDRLRCTP